MKHPVLGWFTAHMRSDGTQWTLDHDEFLAPEKDDGEAVRMVQRPAHADMRDAASTYDKGSGRG